MSSWNNPQIEVYKEFSGQNIQQMPKLIAEGRNPISPSLLFWRKLEVLNEYLRALDRKDKTAAEWGGVMKQWWDFYVDTDYGVARHPDKGAILVPHAQYIRSLDQNTRLIDGYAQMPDGMFEKLTSQGHHYTSTQVAEHGNKQLTMQKALTSPFWQDFIPDKDLRGIVIYNVFGQYLSRFKKNEELMGVFFPNPQKNPIMGLFGFRWLEGRSYAGGGGLLDDVSGRLLGVLSNVAEGDARKLEYIVQHPKSA